MRPSCDRTRGELESALKRVARDYAMGRVPKDAFDNFSESIEHTFTCLDVVEDEMRSAGTYGEAESDTAVGA